MARIIYEQGSEEATRIMKERGNYAPALYLDPTRHVQAPTVYNPDDLPEVMREAYMQRQDELRKPDFFRGTSPVPLAAKTTKNTLVVEREFDFEGMLEGYVQLHPEMLLHQGDEPYFTTNQIANNRLLVSAAIRDSLETILPDAHEFFPELFQWLPSEVAAELFEELIALLEEQQVVLFSEVHKDGLLKGNKGILELPVLRVESALKQGRLSFPPQTPRVVVLGALLRYSPQTLSGRLNCSVPAFLSACAFAGVDPRLLFGFLKKDDSGEINSQRLLVNNDATSHSRNYSPEELSELRLIYTRICQLLGEYGGECVHTQCAIIHDHWKENGLSFKRSPDDLFTPFGEWLDISPTIVFNNLFTVLKQDYRLSVEEVTRLVRKFNTAGVFLPSLPISASFRPRLLRKDNKRSGPEDVVSYLRHEQLLM